MTDTLSDTARRTDLVVQAFREAFSDACGLMLARAPGRVNLIGEHTDYNDGYVLPIAVDRDFWVAFRPSDEARVDLVALNLGERGGFALTDFAPNRDSAWIRYPAGVAHLLSEAGVPLRGMQAVLHSTIPIGGGMSSSAALCVASTLAMCSAVGAELDRITVAKLCQQVEHRFAGVRCGIMDQYVSLFGEEKRAVLLDCRSLTHELVPFESVHGKLVVFDTGVRHSLAASAYNQRREECREAVEYLKSMFAGITSLRDVAVQDFLDVQDELPENLRKRARHVVTENARTLAAARALRRRNLIEFGVLMGASHESLRDDYEASCAELDALVEITSSTHGEFGSRMTGGGFGGCAITLVDSRRLEEFCREVPQRYKAKTGRTTRAYVAEACEGAQVRCM